MIRRARNALRDTVDALWRVHTTPFEPMPPEAWSSIKNDDGPVRCPCLIGIGLVYYALWMAAQTIFCLQWSVEPSVGGLSGLISAVTRAAPLWSWIALYWALGWLGTAYAMALPFKALPASIRRATRARVVGAAVALGASAALFAWLHSSHYLLPWTASFFTAPLAMVVIVDRLSSLYKKAAFTAFGAAAALIVAGWFAPSLVVAIKPLTEDERSYANYLTSGYNCDFGFRRTRSFLARSVHDYVFRVVDVERQTNGLYKARVHVSGPISPLPSYGAVIYFAEQTTTIVRPDYVGACSNDSRRLRRAPWRWQRSADGGASWADVPHNPHTQSAVTARYTFRYVPTEADLADASILLRACVDVRGGGELCSPGVSPRP